MTSTLQVADVRLKIADLLVEHMDISKEDVLADVPFFDLHKDFDSLTMLELQLLLEKAYSFEFIIDVHDKNAHLPNNATELALELIKQHGNSQSVRQAR